MLVVTGIDGVAEREALRRGVETRQTPWPGETLLLCNRSGVCGLLYQQAGSVKELGASSFIQCQAEATARLQHGHSTVEISTDAGKHLMLCVRTTPRVEMLLLFLSPHTVFCSYQGSFTESTLDK